jgi:hypothetical protein
MTLPVEITLASRTVTRLDTVSTVMSVVKNGEHDEGNPVSPAFLKTEQPGVASTRWAG